MTSFLSRFAQKLNELVVNCKIMRYRSKVLELFAYNMDRCFEFPYTNSSQLKGNLRSKILQLVSKKLIKNLLRLTN